MEPVALHPLENQMGDGNWINDFEQLVLLAVVQLGDEAYGMRIRQEIEERGGRAVPIASVYAALERLDDRGYLESWLAEPTPERGGRAKKYFRVTAEGAEQLRACRRVFDRMWDGLDPRVDLETT